jgi:alkylation response protein AidB-like acyl-CoA dehydrogenase
MVVMEELGRGIVLEPYAQGALIAGGVLAAAAPDEVRSAWLPKIATGAALVVLAHQERAARYRLAHVQSQAAQTGGTWSLSGSKSVVPAGDHADAFIVPARVSAAVDDPAGIALFLVERRAVGVTTRGYPTQDGAHAAEVAFDKTPATLIAGAGEGFAALELGIDIGIAALCAEAVGAMDALVAITVEYMNTRKQFGVAIGTFQALRHRIADVKMQLELARSMSYFASLKMSEPPPARRRAMAQAKMQLGQSMRFVGQQCIQLHGGIGVTDEYAASHYFKRLTVMEMSYGDTLHQLGIVSATMQDTAGVFA